MTQHSSLKMGRGRKRHRSVLKRFERVKILKDKKEWEEEKSVFGLPKVKTIRIKIKKEKAATPVAEAETAPGTPPAATPQAAPATPQKEKAAPAAPTPKKEKEK